MNCPVCNGNDGDTPCAYPGLEMPGCLRDDRLQREEETALAEELSKEPDELPPFKQLANLHGNIVDVDFYTAPLDARIKDLSSKLDAIRLKCEHEIKLDQRTPPFAEGRMDFADVIWRMIVQEPPK